MKLHPFDPPIAKNGLCVECEKERPVIGVTHGDPFCSADCCKAWYSKHGPKKEKAA